MKKIVSFIGVLIALLLATATSKAQTKLIDNGPDGAKKVIVVMGDGYASADQTKYKNDVNNILINGVFANDFFRENHNAFNVIRLNLVSVDSGVSQRTYDEKGTPNDPSDDTIKSEVTKNTALRYIYNNSWSHCWMEKTPSLTDFYISEALRGIPKYDYVVIILNESKGGGCGGGGFQVITSGVGWDLLAHEFGHGIGGLWDEYSQSGTTYRGGAVNGPNCSNVLSLVAPVDVHWKRFINPVTPIPTVFGAGMDSNRTVGMFEGCGTKAKRIWRPVQNCRMNGNSPPYCPVCHTHMKKLLFPYLGHSFSKAVAGDFNGDGRTDTLIHNGQDLSIYQSNGTALNLVWAANNIVPAAVGGTTWSPALKDQYFVADFDADGKDDVFVFNDGTDWGGNRYLGLLRSDGTGLQGVARYDNSISTSWTLAYDDSFFVGDFDGDRKADLFIFNRGVTGGTLPGTVARLVMLKSNGTSLSKAARYDGSLPGWSLQSGDRHFVGDFDFDGKADLYVFNGTNWGSTKYLAMLKSSGTGLSRTALYTNSLPGTPGWSFAASDQFYVGDFDGDRKSDLYIFNGVNWGTTAYLSLAKSTGTGLSVVKRYDSASATIPGWAMRAGDRFFVSDANKDSKADLFVFNPAVNWPTEYLGTLISSGTALTGSYSADWVGGWNLGAADQILVAQYEGGVGKSDVFIRNNDWFGLLRRNSTGFVMDRIYYHWIYTALYDSKPWSDSLP
jgi:hypothetical protein